MLSKSISESPRAGVSLCHCNFSSNRSYNGSNDQKTYQDAGMHYHGALKKNQVTFTRRKLKALKEKGRSMIIRMDIIALTVLRIK